jgi:hypothetical protein
MASLDDLLPVTRSMRGRARETLRRNSKRTMSEPIAGSLRQGYGDPNDAPGTLSSDYGVDGADLLKIRRLRNWWKQSRKNTGKIAPVLSPLVGLPSEALPLVPPLCWAQNYSVETPTFFLQRSLRHTGKAVQPSKAGSLARQRRIGVASTACTGRTSKRQ